MTKEEIIKIIYEIHDKLITGEPSIESYNEVMMEDPSLEDLNKIITLAIDKDKKKLIILIEESNLSKHDQLKVFEEAVKDMDRITHSLDFYGDMVSESVEYYKKLNKDLDDKLEDMNEENNGPIVQ